MSYHQHRQEILCCRFLVSNLLRLRTALCVFRTLVCGIARSFLVGCLFFGEKGIVESNQLSILQLFRVSSCNRCFFLNDDIEPLVQIFPSPFEKRGRILSLVKNLPSQSGQEPSLSVWSRTFPLSSSSFRRRDISGVRYSLE
jgi:hypothetical protein